MDGAVLEGLPERPAGRDDVALPDEFVKRARPHAFGERRGLQRLAARR